MTSSSGWLDDQVALVTGGGSGIGRAVVERYLREGAAVGVLDLNDDRLDDLDEELDDVVTIQGDVTNLDDNRRAVERTIDAFGRLDVFVGNAGTFDGNVSLPELPDDATESFHELFDVNVLGYILGAKAALPALVESEGRIVFTASNASSAPDGGGILYVPSKHAVLGVVRQLAFELAPKVRVNGVAPGYVPTNLADAESLSSEQGVVNPDVFDPTNHPLELTPRPEDYTGPYVLLGSPEETKPMTGSVITADLGRSIRGITSVGGRALEYITEDIDFSNWQ